MTEHADTSEELLDELRALADQYPSASYLSVLYGRAANEIERLRRERAAAPQSVVWRANWMDRAVNAISELRDELDPDDTDPLWSSLLDLIAEEFNDGDEADRSIGGPR